MKKILAIWMFLLIFAFMSSTAFAQAQFLIDDQNPIALTLLTVPPNSCQTVTITLDPGGVINTSLITAGCGINYDVSQVLITNVVVADANAGGPWDPAFTQDHGDSAGPGTYYILMGNFNTVPINQGPIPICDVEFCSQGKGTSEIFISPGYGWDNIVGDTTIWDPHVANGVINLTVDEDTDGDGIRDGIDNCPNTPNGPDLGTCTEGTIGETCMNNDACDPNGVCSMNQEDMDIDGVGDVCDAVQMCKGNFDYDGDVDGSDAALFKLHFGRSAFSDPCPPDGPAPTEKTGQTTSYATGDDGDLKKGVAWPNPRFTDNGDGTVTDNLTGLIWLKDADCFGDSYWSQALSYCNGLSNGFCGLTDDSNAGDWRLPNLFELGSLRDMKYNGPCLSDTNGTGQWSQGDPFNNLHQGHYYWSSTADPNNYYAWFVFMFNGYEYYASKTGVLYNVWPVRDPL